MVYYVKKKEGEFRICDLRDFILEPIPVGMAISLTPTLSPGRGRGRRNNGEPIEISY